MQLKTLAAAVSVWRRTVQFQLCNGLVLKIDEHSESTQEIKQMVQAMGRSHCESLRSLGRPYVVGCPARHDA